MANNEINEQATQNESVAKVEKAQPQKVDKKKAKVNKPKKVNGINKTMSELKKVTWPSFKEVVKQTSIVIVVVLAFLLVIFGLDKLCSWLIGLICS